MARRRYQRGSLKFDIDRWVARWREDVILPPGSYMRKGDKLLPSGKVLHRRYKQEIFALEDYPTKRLMQRKLEQLLQEMDRVDYAQVSSNLVPEPIRCALRGYVFTRSEATAIKLLVDSQIGESTERN